MVITKPLTSHHKLSAMTLLQRLRSMLEYSEMALRSTSQQSAAQGRKQHAGLLPGLLYPGSQVRNLAPYLGLSKQARWGALGCS